MNGAAPASLPDAADLTDADRWILGRLEEVRAEVDSTFDSYEFNRGPGVYEMLLFHDRVLRGDRGL